MCERSSYDGFRLAVCVGSCSYCATANLDILISLTLEQQGKTTGQYLRALASSCSSGQKPQRSPDRSRGAKRQWVDGTATDIVPSHLLAGDMAVDRYLKESGPASLDLTVNMPDQPAGVVLPTRWCEPGVLLDLQRRVLRSCGSMASVGSWPASHKL